MSKREERSRKDVFQAMVRAVSWTAQALAQQVDEVEGGVVIRTPALPRVWSVNHIALWSVPDPDAAVALAERLQGDLPFRHIQVLDPAASLDEQAFTRAGWRVDREVYMELVVTPPAPTRGQEPVELTEHQVTRLMGEWIEEDHPGIAAESRAQIEEASRREGRLWGEQAFGVVAGDGRPLAVTKLRIGRGVAWVEDVFTSAPARGRGHARRLVTHASVLAAAADADATFIVADDNDWPKNLYSSLGFQPVGLTWTLHRDDAAP